jgi:hypothetical protein
VEPRGGGLKGLRVLDITGKPEGQLCHLFLSMMEKLNVRLKMFGDAKSLLE